MVAREPLHQCGISSVVLGEAEFSRVPNLVVDDWLTE